MKYEHIATRLVIEETVDEYGKSTYCVADKGSTSMLVGAEVKTNPENMADLIKLGIYKRAGR